MHWPVERVFDGVAPVSRVLRDLPTERINPRTRDLDQLASADLLAAINGEDAGVAQAVDREIPNIARALDAIHQRFARGGRLVYIGAGTSGRLGVLDAAEMPPTFGVDPGRVLGVMAGGQFPPPSTPPSSPCPAPAPASRIRFQRLPASMLAWLA